MFFSKVVALASLPFLVAALPSPSSSDTCSTGSLQCCNSTQSSDSTSVTDLLGLLGIVVGDITGLVGLGCSPISVIGVSGGSCSANAVCCEDNSSANLISLGCVPVTL